MSHGLFMLDGDGRIEVANRKATRVLSYRIPMTLPAAHLKPLALGTRNGLIAKEYFDEINEHLASGQRRDERALVRTD
jgi:PAS domain-containing protein